MKLLIKKISLILLIIFICTSCGTKDEKIITEGISYSNDNYTIQYPSNWECVERKEDGSVVVFSNKDNQIYLELTSARIYPYTDEQKYINKLLKGIREDINVEECLLSGNKGYKVKSKNDNEINDNYIIQERDMIFEMRFNYQDNESNNHEQVINKIKDTFKIKDFETLEYASKDINGDRDAKWLTDIEFLCKQLPNHHKNLFFKIDEQEFLKKANIIKENIHTLTDNELITEVSRWIASIGDAHTRLLFNIEKKYPFEFYYFNEGVYLIDSISEYSDFIGYKLKSIDGISVEEIIKLFTPIIPHENESRLKELITKSIIIPEFLDGLKITSQESAQYTFVDENRNEHIIKAIPKRFNYKDLIIRNTDKSEKMLYLKNRNENYWYQYYEEEMLLYFKYNKCSNMALKSFSDFNDELFKFIDNNSVNKLVIDLRNNEGGSEPILDPFFIELNKRQNLNQSDKLFVVVGRGTFSSAMLNTLTFKNKTNATFIGEPTGAKPNHYGQVQLLELRNTDSKVSYSVKYFERLSEDIESFIPDIIIEPNAEDYFNNIDSVMKTIIEYK